MFTIISYGNNLMNNTSINTMGTSSYNTFTQPAQKSEIIQKVEQVKKLMKEENKAKIDLKKEEKIPQVITEKKEDEKIEPKKEEENEEKNVAETKIENKEEQKKVETKVEKKTVETKVVAKKEEKKVKAKVEKKKEIKVPEVKEVKKEDKKEEKKYEKKEVRRQERKVEAKGGKNVTYTSRYNRRDKDRVIKKTEKVRQTSTNKNDRGKRHHLTYEIINILVEKKE